MSGHEFPHENVSEDVEIVTDEFNAYPGAMKTVGLTEREKRSSTRRMST